MPSYNLRFTDGERNLREEGIELADDTAAHAFAFAAARELMGRTVAGNDWTRWRMEVADETGRLVLAAPLGEIPAAAPHVQLLPHPFRSPQP